jgi:DNA-binding transcriptional LysR family regulator
MIEDLKTFVTVIDEASLTRAADILCVSQSAISKRIQRLEQLLGAELFDRDSKPPRPTALANRVYEQAVALLGAWSHLLDVSQEGAAPSGTFRFGLPQAVADVALFDAVVKMNERFPALKIRLHTQWSPALQRAAEQGQLDAAVLMLPDGTRLARGLTGQQIVTFEVKVIQSADKPLVKRKSSIRSLVAHGWILNPDGCGYRAALERSMEAAGERLRVSVDSHATNIQLGLVSAGLGLGLVPLEVLRTSPYRDQLEILDVSDFKLTLGVWLVYPHQTGNLKPAIDALAESLCASFERQAVKGLRKAEKGRDESARGRA